jgi:hypothetical protein
MLAQKPKKAKKRVPPIALRLPRKYDSLYIYCLAVWLKMKADTLHFASPYPPAAQIDKDLVDLHNALQDAEGGGTVEASALVSAADQVRSDFNILAKYAEGIIRTLPSADASAIIASLLLQESKVGQRPPKAELAAGAGPTSGIVVLAALAVLNAVSYYWEISSDQTTWTETARSAQAHARISGLTPGKLYYFRFCCLLRDGTMTDPSNVINFIIR